MAQQGNPKEGFFLFRQFYLPTVKKGKPCSRFVFWVIRNGCKNPALSYRLTTGAAYLESNNRTNADGSVLVAC